MEIYHTPGETDDHLTVWLPGKRVVLPGDNIYESFPNLYAIRGSPPRNAHTWYKSLDFVRSLGAEHMVPSHTRPLSGRDAIHETLTAYRDAIQFTHDQTVRQMNKRVDIGEIVARVRLPPRLRDHRYLQEFYGTVEWSVRGVYDLYTGWFDGDPVHLFPLTNDDEARRYAQMLTSSRDDGESGHAMMLRHALLSLQRSSRAFESGRRHLRDELQWALVLTSHAMRACDRCPDAKELYIEVLRRLAGASKNANARNYYLTSAVDARRGHGPKVQVKDVRAVLKEMSIEEIMSYMPYRLKSEGCDDGARLKVAVEFTDIGEVFLYQLRNCVLQLDQGPDEAMLEGFDSRIKTTVAVWKSVITEEKSGFRAYMDGDVKLEGSPWTLQKFMGVFDMT